MSPTLINVVLISLGLTPSLVWLYFFAKKDCHPEPKNLLAQTFLMGIIISPIAILLQFSFAQLASTITAMENILVMFRVFPDGAQTTLATWALRFTGATLLHALSSGLMGYFLAMSWFFQDHKKKLIVVGLIMATIFHFTFNTFLSAFEDRVTSLIYSTSLLLIMAFLVSILFDKIKERRGKTAAGPAITSPAFLKYGVSNKSINLLG